MIEVNGVRVKKEGKIYYFNTVDQNVSVDSYVIVVTIRGVEIRKVVITNKRIDEEDVVLPLKKVIRIATEEDKEVVVKNQEQAKEALQIGTDKINYHRLEMN